MPQLPAPTPTPTLLHLCRHGLASSLRADPQAWTHQLFSLPEEDLVPFLASLSPLHLQSLHKGFLHWKGSLGSSSPLKRSYDEMLTNDVEYLQQKAHLNLAWKAQFSARWPGSVKQRYHQELSSSELELLGICKNEAQLDWHCHFWEAHIQECINEAAAQVCVDPLGFSLKLEAKRIGDIIVTGYVNGGNSALIQGSTTLKQQCEEFGQYARSVKLRNVLCTVELSTLLMHANLEHISLYFLSNEQHVEGLCLLLSRNKGALQTLELHNCKLQLCFVDKIFKSLIHDTEQTHRLQHIFFLSCCITWIDEKEGGYRDFLHAGRCLKSFVLAENRLHSVRLSWILRDMLQSATNMSVLHVCDHELDGFFFREFLISFPSMGSSSNPKCTISLPLKSLNLRSISLDQSTMKDMISCIHLMPFLQQIDLSENPIGDVGLRGLLGCLDTIALSELNVSACLLSSKGASMLFEKLLMLNRQLKFLSVAHNNLGGSVVTLLAEIMSKGLVQRLDIEDIALGSLGCLQFQEALTQIQNLTHFNISKNRLGSSSSGLLCKLISESKCLKVLNISWNLLALESLEKIAYALNRQRDNGVEALELLDVRGNSPGKTSHLFESNASTLVLTTCIASGNHDDDP